MRGSLPPIVALIIGAPYFVDPHVAKCQDFQFRRVSGPVDPNVDLSVTATANTEGDLDESTIFGELISELTVDASAAAEGAFADAHQQGTATSLLPVGSASSVPTVDTSYLMGGTSSGSISSATASENVTVGVTATFEAEAPGKISEGFLHGFLYLAENGGVVTSGDGAGAEVYSEDDDNGINASIDEFSVEGVR